MPLIAFDPDISGVCKVGGTLVMISNPPKMASTKMVSRPSAMSMSSAAASLGGGAVNDQEKAALIMQVLQLSDQQISMLPPDQRQSILILKEQIARSGGPGGMR